MTSLGTATLDLVGDRKGLERDLKGAEDSVKKLGEKMKKAGKALSVSITAPILAIGVGAFAAANSFDKAMGIIQTGTGATGEALEGLEASFKTVFDIVPASAEEVATALADLNTMTGLTGKLLEDATVVALELGDAMGVDVSMAIGSVGAAMNAFGEDTENISAIMDFLFTTSQNTGQGVDALAEQLTAYGPVTKNLGLSMTETIDLFGRLGNSGIAVSRIMPGVNAFMRRAAGANDEMAEALSASSKGLEDQKVALVKNRADHKKASQALELHILRMQGFTENTSAATKRAAEFKLEELTSKVKDLNKEYDTGSVAVTSLTGAHETLRRRFEEVAGQGVDVRARLDEVIQSIKTAATDTDALNIATDAFGAEGAQRLVVAIKNGTFALDDLAQSTAESEGAILANAAATQTAGDKFRLLKNDVILALVPLGETLMEVLLGLQPLFETLIGAVEFLVDLFERMGPVGQIVVFAFAGLLAILGPLLILLPTLVGGFTAVLALLPLLTVGVGALGTAITFATGPIGLVILAIVALIAAGVLIWKNWDTIKKKTIEIWTAIIHWIKGLWTDIVALFKDNWELILTILFPPVGIALLIKKHWGAIKDVMRTIWDGVVQVVKSAVNSIIGLINSVLQVWNDLEFGVGPFKVGIGEFSRTVGPWTFGTPNVPLIPMLATGGLVMGPTLAMLGEGGPEAIIPLDRLEVGEGGANGGRHFHFHAPVMGVDSLEEFIRSVSVADQRGGVVMSLT